MRQLRAGLAGRLFAPALIVLTLGGCSQLLAKPAPHLYRISIRNSFPPGLPRSRVQLLVDVPAAPEGLDTRRIALFRPPVSFDYYADSEWTDRVPVLVQTALLDGFEDSHAIPAIGRDSAGLRADIVLRSEIRHFEADYPLPSGVPTVRVAIVARLVRHGRIIAAAPFAARQPASANSIAAVVAAFDQALSRVTRQAVLWTLANPALSAARHKLS